jgi:hypothetical protein
MALNKGKGKGNSQSWRDLSGKKTGGNKRTRVARLRRLQGLFKTGLAALILLGAVAILLGVFTFWQFKPQMGTTTAEAALQIDFQTDGVLTRDWLRREIPGLKGKALRELDVAELKATLLAVGQVADARVALQLPATLKVQVKERNPMLRVRVRSDKGEPQLLLIGRDGFLYEGFGYPKEMLLRLPGATGLRLRKGPDGYLPVRDIEQLAKLIELAQERLPVMFRYWRVFDLSDWRPEEVHRDPLVHVRSSHIERITFSLRDPAPQLERLREVMRQTQRYQLKQPRQIDLSLGEDVVVETN